MATMLGIMVPLFGFMLIPVWIPLIAIAAGAVLDRVRPAELTPAMTIVADAKQRSARTRSRFGADVRPEAPESLAA